MTQAMQIKNSNYRERIREIFNTAPFVVDLGIRFQDAGPGWCETELPIAPRHWQQDNYIHGGVQATLADHTAGAAAATLVAENEIVLTVEFKISLLRPAQGELLRCRAEVLKPGKTLIVVESEVFCSSTLVSKGMFTIAAISKNQEG
jgi:uncharacterized protein (TIGR00369 family)